MVKTRPRSPRGRFEEHRRLLEAQAVDMIANLSPMRIAALREEFDKRGGELDRNSFVAIVHAYLPEDVLVKYHTLPSASQSFGEDVTEIVKPTMEQIVGVLAQLFDLVDAGGNMTVSWNEFARYIVEKGSTRRNAYAVDVIPEYEEVRVALSSVSPTDVTAAPTRDAVVVEKMALLSAIDCIAVAVSRSPLVRVYALQALRLHGLLDAGVKNQKGTIESLTYFESATGTSAHRADAKMSGFLATAASDASVAVWNLAPGPRQYSLVLKFNTSYSQTALCYCPRYSMLYSGSSMGLIHTWDVKHGYETSCMSAHTDVVTDIVMIPSLDQIVSSSMDHTVRVWDCCSGALRMTLRGHGKGVVCLAYCEAYQYIISGSYDHDVILWSPLVPVMLYKLRGHSLPIVSIRYVPDSPQLLTASMDGLIKVWDLRNLTCVQSITADVGEGSGGNNLNCVEVCPARKQFLCGSQRFLLYKQSFDAELLTQADTLPIVSAVCVDNSFISIVASGQSVTIWSTLTGRPVRVFRDIVRSDITAFALHPLQRRFLLGCADGWTREYNVSNGLLVRTFKKHPAEIAALCYCDKGRVVTCGKDGGVWLHGRPSAEENVLPTQADVAPVKMDASKLHRGDVNCAAKSSEHPHLIATGAADNSARLWDIDAVKLSSVLPHSGPEVTAVVFLDPYAYVFTADSNGNNYIWSTALGKHGLIACWKHSPAHFSPYSPPFPGESAPPSPVAIRPMVSPITVVSSPMAGGGRGKKNSLRPREKPLAPFADLLKPEPAPAPAPPPVVVDPVLAASKYQQSFVTAAAWDSTSRVLFAADFAGQLCAWDLDPLLDTVDLAHSSGRHSHRTASRSSPAKNGLSLPGVPAEIADAMCAGRYAAIPDDVPTVLLSGPALVKLNWAVFGHKESVASLQLCHALASSPFLLSSGADGSVFAWSLSGDHVGTLCHDVFAGRNPAWDIAFDIPSLQSAEDCLGAEVLDRVRHMDFTPCRDADYFASDTGTPPEDAAHPDRLRAILEGRWRGSQGAARPVSADKPKPGEEFGAPLIELYHMSMARQKMAATEGGSLRQGVMSRVSSGGVSRARELLGSQKIITTESSVLRDVAKRSLTRDEKVHLSSTHSLLLSKDGKASVGRFSQKTSELAEKLQKMLSDS